MTDEVTPNTVDLSTVHSKIDAMAQQLGAITPQQTAPIDTQELAKAVAGVLNANANSTPVDPYYAERAKLRVAINTAVNSGDELKVAQAEAALDKFEYEARQAHERSRAEEAAKALDQQYDAHMSERIKEVPQFDDTHPEYDEEVVGAIASATYEAFRKGGKEQADKTFDKLVAKVGLKTRVKESASKHMNARESQTDVGTQGGFLSNGGEVGRSSWSSVLGL